MRMPKTAAEYAEMAAEQVEHAAGESATHQAMRFQLAQVLATLALAAATLEATTPPWLEDHEPDCAPPSCQP